MSNTVVMVNNRLMSILTPLESISQPSITAAKMPITKPRIAQEVSVPADMKTTVSEPSRHTDKKAMTESAFAPFSWSEIAPSAILSNSSFE